MNQITLIGRVPRRTTYHCDESARDMLRFIVETTSTGSAEDSPDGATAEQQQHHCIAWGPAALDLHANLNPGDRVMIRGELNYRNHKSARGELRRFPEIRVVGYTYLGQEAPTVRGREAVRKRYHVNSYVRD